MDEAVSKSSLDTSRRIGITPVRQAWTDEAGGREPFIVEVFE